MGNLLKAFEDAAKVAKPYKKEVFDRYEHQRSALTYLMLMDGFKYLMCEVADEEKDFYKFDSFEIVIITQVIQRKDGNLNFCDIEGNTHNAAQPINSDGSVMAYWQYLELKSLRGK